MISIKIIIVSFLIILFPGNPDEKINNNGVGRWREMIKNLEN